jgi:two-component system chemotaxis sensor kinase CheA
VTAVGAAQEALALARETTGFHVVVSDIEMPDMNGFELAEALRADPRTAQLPIIALSSLTNPAAIERGRQAGFHDYVAKFDRQGLIAALKETSIEYGAAA